MSRPLVLLNVAALSPSQIGDRTPRLRAIAEKGALSPLTPPLPALTCPSHATMVTGLTPAEHGIIGNCFYDPALAQIFNWARSDRLVSGERIWDAARKEREDFRCINLFFRFCTHSSCNVTVTERPIYWADGRKGAGIYADPPTVGTRLLDEQGDFPFFTFWGPRAGLPSTTWILKSALQLMNEQHPDLLLVYAPFLDYDAQRFGPDSDQAQAALGLMDAALSEFIAQVNQAGADLAIVSDYGFVPVSRPLYPNRLLRQHGFVRIDEADNGELLEPGASRAFAVADNQVAHVYVRDPADIKAVQALLENMDGVARVLDSDALAQVGLQHPRGGQLVALAERDAWFAYPYWLEPDRAPDFAHCVEIFRKPGFDPSELFLRPGVAGKLHLAKRVGQLKTNVRAPFDVISGDASLVGGARNIDVSDHEHGAVLITSWQRDQATTPVPMTALKSLLLERML